MALIRSIGLLLLGLAITLAGTIWPNIAFTKGYQFDWSPMHDLAIGFGYYVITLIGILSSILFKKLETKGDESISFGTLGSILRGGEGIRGIIVSPLIFISSSMRLGRMQMES